MANLKDTTVMGTLSVSDKIVVGGGTAVSTTVTGGLKIKKVTAAEFSAITTKDPNTLYVVVG